MFCGNCGKPLNEGALFCPECGTPVKKIETEMKSLSQDMENINTINKYREIYKYHKKNPHRRSQITFRYGITTRGLIIHRLAHGVISYIHYCSAFRLLDLFLQLYLPWVVQTVLI